MVTSCCHGNVKNRVRRITGAHYWGALLECINNNNDNNNNKTLFNEGLH
jgi:hypothetical protein